MSNPFFHKLRSYYFEHGFSRIYRSIIKKLFWIIFCAQLYLIFITPFYFNDLNYNVVNIKGKKFAELVTDPVSIKESLKSKTEKNYVGKMTKSEYSVCYIHGFSASRQELEPAISQVAQSLNANLFFTRLKGHGFVSSNALKNVSAQDWMDDALECLEVASRTGNKVILIGTSLGGSLASLIAANTNSKIHSLVLVSPNFGLKDSKAFLLAGYYGGFIADLFFQGERSFKPKNNEQKKVWTTSYPSSVLKSVMMITMSAKNLNFKNLNAPTFLALSENDEILDVSMMKQKFDQIRGPKQIDFDPSYTEHVLAGNIMNPKGTPHLTKNILNFIKSNP